MSASPAPQRSYTARDVQDVAGLSYRQLNVWSARGVLPGQGGRGAGWRRFFGRDLFALAVCVEIRRHFGVPVGRLGHVIEALRSGKPDMLVEAASLTAETGASVWLVTDLEDTCVLRTEAEAAAFVADGFRGDSPAGLLWVKVNPLVKRLVARLREEEIPSGVRQMLETPEEEATSCTPEESEVLRLIRSGDYRSIEVVMDDGEIKTVHTARRVAGTDTEAIADLVRQHDYQKITLTRFDGRLVEVEQRVSRKVRA
jgi:hypothetical protein